MPALDLRVVDEWAGFLHRLAKGKGFSITPSGPSHVSPLGARPFTFNRPSVMAA